MSAMVCGKRSFFEELPASPASVSPPASKKLRRSSSPSAVSDPIDHLRAVFPNVDKQLLEKALEESGYDLSNAIKSLNGLCFGSVDGNSGHVAPSNAAATGEEYVRSGGEWVEVFVTEMMNASSVDDARCRAMRMLERLEKSINKHNGGEAAQSLHKENMGMKEQMEVVVRENTILKRAVAIQHERQKDYDESIQEVQQLKQLVSMYQEQLRTLEVNNYALKMHLRQAQESNSSIPGRFHPDVF